MSKFQSVNEATDQIPLRPIPQREGRPYILVDGLISTAHNTLINIAIARAANEARNLNVGYLCYDGSTGHYTNTLYKKAGLRPFELGPISQVQASFFKVRARLTGYWKAIQGESGLLNLKAEGVPIGDLVYDGVIRGNSDVYTVEGAAIDQARTVVESALRRARAVRTLFRSEPIDTLVLSHKVYAMGIPARMATANGIEFISRSRAHLNRINSMEGHVRNDYVLTVDEMDEVLELIGRDRVSAYVRSRFRGDADGTDAQFAFGDKVGYETSELRSAMGLDERPVGLIAPHAFSDAPHCDRDMLYPDYYQWFTRTLELTQEIDDIQWVVKPHPSSSLYQEKGVVAERVSQHGHVQLVPDDVKTDSVLHLADAVLTVRGTIGMEALLFDCKVLLGGNAIYEEIQPVTVCLTEQKYWTELSSIKKKKTVSERAKRRAMATLYYRNKSYRYVSPLFGPERMPGLPSNEARDHDRENIERAASFLENNAYKDDEYYNQLVTFFESNKNKLSILDLAK